MDLRTVEVKRPNQPNANISIIYSHGKNQKLDPNPIVLHHAYGETFHRQMKVLFAVMPIHGIHGPTAASLRYSFSSLRNFYTLMLIFVQLAHAGIILHFNFVTGYTFDKMFPILWFTVNPFVMYQFIRMAYKWPGLMQHWEVFERTIARRDVKIYKQMRKIMLATSIGIPVCACLEHIFSLGNNVITAGQCRNATDTMTAYFKGAFPGYFYFFSVNYLNGISLQIMNVYTTFAWSMTDAFILLISLGLITQFRHFNVNFERFKRLNLPPEYWAKQRIYYTKLTELLDHVNRDVAILVLTSFMVNTFYICVQLFQTMAPSDSIMRTIYHWFSLIYLIGKTFVVIMTAALINDESKKPIKVLESLPAAAYGLDAQRFMHQLTTGIIGLGGMQFFYITRIFLIKVAGTIVTYEIVLMQLKKPPEKDFDPCRTKF